MGSIGFYLLLGIIVYGILIHPNQMIRDITVKALETYQLELKAKIEKSAVPQIIEDKIGTP